MQYRSILGPQDCLVQRTSQPKPIHGNKEHQAAPHTHTPSPAKQTMYKSCVHTTAIIASVTLQEDACGYVRRGAGEGKARALKAERPVIQKPTSVVVTKL